MTQLTQPEPALVKQLIMAYIAKQGGHPIAEDIKEAFEYWEKLFRAYNEANPTGCLRMGCSPCYMKVYLWHKRWKERTMSELEDQARQQFEVLKKELSSTWLNNKEEE